MNQKADKKTAMQEGTPNGAVSLSDEALDTVAGGARPPKCPKCGSYCYPGDTSRSVRCGCSK